MTTVAALESQLQLAQSLLVAAQGRIDSIIESLDAMKKLEGERAWPQVCETVWWLRDYGAIHYFDWNGVSIESERLGFGVIFRTEAEATRERDPRALIAELRRHPKACS